MSSQKSLFNIILCLALITSGCKQATTDKPVELSKDAKDISITMKSMDADKCAIAYKQFAGLSEYMKNAGKDVDTTPKMFMLIERFQTDYSYVRDSADAKDYIDAVEAYLKVKGYEDPRQIVDTVTDDKAQVSRKSIIADMKVLADAAKVALEAKNAKSK